MGHFEVTLGSHWDHFGVTLAPFWYHRFSPKCCGADFGSRIKISGHLLGQDTQNFELYPFRLVLGHQRGLAVEGEAFRIEAPMGSWLSEPSERTNACARAQRCAHEHQSHLNAPSLLAELAPTRLFCAARKQWPRQTRCWSRWNAVSRKTSARSRIKIPM